MKCQKLRWVGEGVDGQKTDVLGYTDISCHSPCSRKAWKKTTTKKKKKKRKKQKKSERDSFLTLRPNIGFQFRNKRKQIEGFPLLVWRIQMMDTYFLWFVLCGDMATWIHLSPAGRDTVIHQNICRILQLSATSIIKSEFLFCVLKWSFFWYPEGQSFPKRLPKEQTLRTSLELSFSEESASVFCLFLLLLFLFYFCFCFCFFFLEINSCGFWKENFSSDICRFWLSPGHSEKQNLLKRKVTTREKTILMCDYHQQLVSFIDQLSPERFIAMHWSISAVAWSCAELRRLQWCNIPVTDRYIPTAMYYIPPFINHSPLYSLCCLHQVVIYP